MSTPWKCAAFYSDSYPWSFQETHKYYKDHCNIICISVICFFFYACHWAEPASIFLDELIYLGLSKETLLAGVYFDFTSLCRSHFGPGSRHEPRDKISAAIYVLPGWTLALPRPKFYMKRPSAAMSEEKRLPFAGYKFYSPGRNTSKYLYMRHVLKPEAT